MKKKTTTALNVNINEELFELLGKVSELTGKTKSALVEEAIINIISPYCNYKYENDTVKRVFEGKPGMYIIDDNPNIATECVILGETVKMGSPYIKIYKDGQLSAVPASYIKYL